MQVHEHTSVFYIANTHKYTPMMRACETMDAFGHDGDSAVCNNNLIWMEVKCIKCADDNVAVYSSTSGKNCLL